MNQETAYLTECPVGCNAPLEPTDILLPEGALLRCTGCGQLISQCSEQRYWESMQEFDDPLGTLPDARSAGRRFKRSRRFLDSIAHLLDKPVQEIRLLDVGCSSGAFLANAVALGVDAEGVEPAPKAAASARTAGLRVRQGFLHEAGYSSGYFDAVTLFEVIEHLKAPLPLLQEINRILKPGGILLIGTGNAASWTASLMKADWEYFSLAAHGGHISFYSPASLEKLAQQAGFVLARLQTRGLRLCDRRTCIEPFRTFAKASAELLSPLTKLFNKGHDLAAYFRKED